MSQNIGAGCGFLFLAIMLFMFIAPASCMLDDKDEALLDAQIAAYEAGQRSSDDVFTALQDEDGEINPFAIDYITDENEKLGKALERHQDQWEEDQKRAEEFNRWQVESLNAEREAQQFCSQLHPRGSSMWRQCVNAKASEIRGR